MRKIISLLLTVLLASCLLTFNTVFADNEQEAQIYNYISEEVTSLSGGSFALTCVSGSGRAGWDYFEIEGNSTSDLINEIKIEYSEDGNSYSGVAIESDINVSISRLGSEYPKTATLTPTSSSIFSNIVITRDSAEATPTAVINSTYQDSNSGIYKITVTFGLPGNNNPNPQEDEDNTFSYSGATYKVGFGNDSSGDTLHIDDASVINLAQTLETLDLMIGVGKLDNKNEIIETASQEIYDKIFQKIVVKDYNDNTVNSFSGYQYKEKQNTTINTRTYPIPVPQEVGNKTITLQFEDYEGNVHTVKYTLNVVRKEYHTYEISSLDDLNNAVKTKAALSAFIASNKDIEGNTVNELNNDLIITFNLSSSGSYNGLVTFDCKEIDDNYQIILRGSNTENQEYDNQAFIKKYVDGERATLAGTIINKSGLSEIHNINFVSDSNVKQDVKLSSNSSSKKSTVGLYVFGNPNTGMMEVKNDITEVVGCTFSGYDYAILCKDSGLASGLRCNKFINNKVAYCVDEIVHNGYSDSQFNYFINNDVAINIIRTSQNPFHYVISKNYFFNNNVSSKDYVVTSEGKFFFNNSYYGKDSSSGITNTNFRNSRVSVGDKSTVITGPCIRYPDAIEGGGTFLGLDVGGSGVNALISGVDNETLKIDENDKQSDFLIEVINNSGEQKGTLVIGGNK